MLNQTLTLLEKQNKLVNDLQNIATEEQNQDTLDIDLLDSLAVVQKINNEDKKVAFAVEKVLPQVAQAVDKIVAAFAVGGRLIYIGAGTSGRLGILDAVECPPTFSVSDKQVLGIIAGGDKAIYKAVEGAEDDPQRAIEDLEKVNFNTKDILVGIAASGRTPYVISAMKYAKHLGATVVGVSCSPKQMVAKIADINLCVAVGPEALTGSTRMKSGTAQKLVLNMLSTASMIRSGKSYRNLMVDVNSSNEKLYARAIRIVMQATHCEYQIAKEALEQAENKAKLAILLVLTGVNAEQGKAMLAKNNGFLRKAVE
ncbi:MAG: N-acetylmuramic acid 6-phosphate etherase [Alteromonadaceae bacterium]|nr:N-acetylmuramic acid 6-phosphate etherase [Alteromonadaceae bacterium]MBL4910813.1 N-acetylmuramic acid 6-phosphate etherase [Alteromonadaceae bacterium]